MTHTSDDASPPAPPLQALIEVLVAHHRAFTSYVERRVGDRALAEEIVQDAFVRSLDHAGEIREGISANNAGVRVFRAREALRQQVARACGTCAQHGCFDCSCGQPQGPTRA